MHYRFYVLDRHGAFIDVIDATCPSDEAAQLEALARLGYATAIQVWQRGRFVGTVERRQAA